MEKDDKPLSGCGGVAAKGGEVCHGQSLRVWNERSSLVARLARWYKLKAVRKAVEILTVLHQKTSPSINQQIRALQAQRKLLEDQLDDEDS
jgi:hypothetical protein